MSRLTSCKFCSRTDDSIQVICESRCLICSRCQLVPVIKKLLLDHAFAGGDNPFLSSGHTRLHQALFTKGTCPICESKMSHSMLILINSYKKEDMKKVKPEDKIMARATSEMELEQHSGAITSFLKRFRITYEVSTAEDTGVNNGILNQADVRFVPTTNELYDAYITLPKTNLNAVLEFVIDCYAAQWSSMTRNAQDSMVSIMMKMFSKKKCSQRTNDFRAKSMLDFISSPLAASNPDLFLFGHLVGLQPKKTNTIRPAWAHITTSIYAASYCDSILKHGKFVDDSGKPTALEFRTRLLKSGEKMKNIPLKKAIKIMELLMTEKQPYWMLTPIIPSCLEYGSRMPWEKDSVSKLLNILLFFSLNDGNGNNAFSTPIETPFLTQRTSGSGTVGGAALPSLGRMGSNNSRNSLTRSSVAFTPVSPVRRTQKHQSTDDHDDHQAVAESAVSSRMSFLQNLEHFLTQFWVEGKEDHILFTKSFAQLNNVTKARPSNKTDILGYLSRFHRNNKSSFLHMTFSDAFELSDNLSISVSELSLISVSCWAAEHHFIKLAISRAKVTGARRPAISGFYDVDHAKMNAQERLCLIRLLHWYNGGDSDFKGIDWDEAEVLMRQRSFPFSVPASLLEKSRNELNHLTEVVAKTLHEQEEKEEIEDAQNEYGPYSKVARGIAQHGTGNLLYCGDTISEDYVTAEEIEKEERRAFLAGQKLGGKDAKVEVERVLKEGESHHFLKHKSRSLMGMSVEEGDKKGSVGIKRLSQFRPGSETFSQEIKSNLDLEKPLRPGMHTDEEVDQMKKKYRSHSTQYASHPDQAAAVYRDAAFIAEQAGTNLTHWSPVHQDHPDHGTQRRVKTPGGEEGKRTEYHEKRPKSPAPLSGLAYKAPIPGRHQLTMPDIVNTGSSVLATVGLMERVQKPGSRTPQEPVTEFRSGIEITDIEQKVHGMDIGSLGDVRAAYRQRHGHHHPAVNEGSLQHSLDGSLTDDNNSTIFSVSTRSGAPPSLSVNERYREQRMNMYTSRQSVARQRIQARIEARSSDGVLTKEQLSKMRSTDGNSRSLVNLSRVLDVDKEKTNLNHSASLDDTNYLMKENRKIEFMNFQDYIDDHGEFVIDLATHLSAESAVQVLSVRDANISLKNMIKICRYYMKPWQLEHMVRLDLAGNNLGLKGANALAEKLKLKCALVHLNLNGMNIGGLGIDTLMKAIIEGGGARTLKRLDMQNNSITMATDTFSILSNFTNLRSLDISKNSFTLDTETQRVTFITAITPMRQLQSLSLAYNKIQDQGLDLVLDLVRKHLHFLELLDVAGCFITGKSIKQFAELLDHYGEFKDTSLVEILLHDNIFSCIKMTDVYQKYEEREPRCKLSFEKGTYMGVEFPLRYDLREHGIKSYRLK